MGALTEAEIFDCLFDNFKSAAQDCENLARSPISGPNYLRLRESLGLIEGACRQAAVWRQDSRWYDIGLYMAEAHKRAGTWLRGYKDPNTGQKRYMTQAERFRNFTMLANNLRSGQRRAEEFKNKKTGRVGMILPEAYSQPRRSKGGIILPQHYQA